MVDLTLFVLAGGIGGGEGEGPGEKYDERWFTFSFGVDGGLEDSMSLIEEEADREENIPLVGEQLLLVADLGIDGAVNEIMFVVEMSSTGEEICSFDTPCRSVRLDSLSALLILFDSDLANAIAVVRDGRSESKVYRYCVTFRQGQECYILQ